MTDTVQPPDPRWHWRNCRELSISLTLFVWPWRFGVQRDDDVYGGRMVIAIGPIGIGIVYSHGDISREPWTIFDRIANRTGLSEVETYLRAARWEDRHD